MTSEPSLSLPDFQTGQFVVTTDASTKGNGAILSQIINGEEKVIAYASRTLTPGESNYSATQLELLSIIHHLEKFKHYLVGRKFKLRSDHKSLQYLQTFKMPTEILARWILKIQDLDYEFEHLKGKQNAPCDYLSRFPDNTPVENENEEVNTIKAKHVPKNKGLKLKSVENNSVEKEQKNSPLSLNSIKIYQKKDNTCAALIEHFLYDKELPDEMKSFKKEIDNYFYDIDEKILCRIMTDNNRSQTSIVPVLPQILQKPAFEFFHSEVGGHLGIYKTFHRLK